MLLVVVLNDVLKDVLFAFDGGGGGGGGEAVMEQVKVKNLVAAEAVDAAAEKVRVVMVDQAPVSWPAPMRHQLLPCSYS